MKTAAEIAREAGIASDEAMILQGAATCLLAAAARGEIDLNRLAREELANRGLDRQGSWVGFDAAARIHRV